MATSEPVEQRQRVEEVRDGEGHEAQNLAHDALPHEARLAREEHAAERVHRRYGHVPRAVAATKLAYFT